MKMEELFKNKLFITDIGIPPETKAEICDEKMLINRYAVWAPSVTGNNHMVVEVGEDLKYLMEKYNIPQDSVCVFEY